VLGMPTLLRGDSVKKEIITFREVIPANTLQTLEFKERIKANGTIETVKVRFYKGQQKALEVYPFVRHKGNKDESLITYSGSTSHLSGDDDYFIYDVVVPVENDDQMMIHVKNIDPTYAYTMVVDVAVDYYGGKDRVV
jgi:hypothetical protein